MSRTTRCNLSSYLTNTFSISSCNYLPHATLLEPEYTIFFLWIYPFPSHTPVLRQCSCLYVECLSYASPHGQFSFKTLWIKNSAQALSSQWHLPMPPPAEVETPSCVFTAPWKTSFITSILFSLRIMFLPSTETVNTLGSEIISCPSLYPQCLAHDRYSTNIHSLD